MYLEVNQFLSSLVNLEKTRNFNVFKNYSLDSFQLVLESFGLLPRNQYPTRISVVGTNGKGSIAYYLSQIAFRSEMFSTVGLYTSPHLITQNERIQVNGNLIPDDWMNEKLNSYSKEELEKLRTLSYFEIFTFFANLYFQDNDCSLEIYEAGLGGRLDATKLTYPDIVVLTKIGLDHTEILGDTEEKILLEKLQIIGDNTKQIYAFQQEERLIELTKSFCRVKNIELVVYDFAVNNDYLSFNKEFSLFIINDILKRKNIAKVTKRIFANIPDIPGRMQLLRLNPILIFDIGHNPAAITYLLKSLQCLYPKEKKWQVYFGCLKDKDAKSILQILLMNSCIHKIFQINSEGWNSQTISHFKIETISIDQFHFLKKTTINPSLVLGSLRLYTQAKNDD